MNKKQLSELVGINLRMIDPQMTNRLRKKGKTGQSFIQSILTQYALMGLLFLLVYVLPMSTLDFPNRPGVFTFYLSFFGIISFAQCISVVYNIFFENQDLESYLPLPFRERDLFLAKIVVITLRIVPFSLPIYAVFFFTNWRSGVFILLAFLLSILSFFLYLSLLFMLSSLLVFGLLQINFFQKYKKLVMGFLLTFSTIISFLGIIFLSNQLPTTTMSGTDQKAVPLFLPFFYWSRQPFSLPGLLSVAGILGVLVLLIFLMKTFFFPHYYTHLLQTTTVSSSSRKTKTKTSLYHLLFRYNLQLILEPGLLMQILMSSVALPLIYLVMPRVSSRFDVDFLTPSYIGVAFFIGFIFTTLSISPISIAGILISLDKDNFYFIRSLPLSMNYYLRKKFIFAFVFHLILNMLIVLLATVLYHLPLTYFGALLLGTLLGTYLMTQVYFVRDYRLLELNWTNSSQLFTRGNATWLQAFLYLGIMVISAVGIVGYILTLISYPPMYVNGGIFAVFFGGYVFSLRHYQQKFWLRFS